jgi:hypothetical protein
VRAAAHFKVDVENLFSGLPPPQSPSPPEEEEELDIRDLFFSEPLPADAIPEEAIKYFGAVEIMDILHTHTQPADQGNTLLVNLAENTPPLSPGAIAAHAARWE